MNCSVKMNHLDSIKNEMNVFDSLPEKIREYANYNVEGFGVRAIYHCFRNNNFNEEATLDHLKKVGVAVWMR